MIHGLLGIAAIAASIGLTKEGGGDDPERAIVPKIFHDAFIVRGKPIRSCEWEEVDGPLAKPNALIGENAIGDKLSNGKWRVLVCDDALVQMKMDDGSVWGKRKPRLNPGPPDWSKK